MIFLDIGKILEKGVLESSVCDTGVYRFHNFHIFKQFPFQIPYNLAHFFQFSITFNNSFLPLQFPYPSMFATCYTFPKTLLSIRSFVFAVTFTLGPCCSLLGRIPDKNDRCAFTRGSRGGVMIFFEKNKVLGVEPNRVLNILEGI